MIGGHSQNFTCPNKRPSHEFQDEDPGRYCCPYRSPDARVSTRRQLMCILSLLNSAIRHGAFRQCAGISNDRYESTGFLTADFTQKASTASGGSILPDRKGNQKCCNVPDTRQGDLIAHARD
ncbi:unnamed protein product [Phytophthora lilii]|uniref:Unnamed protein product n=1 Tax=Phytophthora lilii TaxID=2077276 RepID=A0A9W6UE27_9STRA|nr:unnamed protein product [Phytophthora lilii]